MYESRREMGAHGCSGSSDGEQAETASDLHPEYQFTGNKSFKLIRVEEQGRDKRVYRESGSDLNLNGLALVLKHKFLKSRPTCTCHGTLTALHIGDIIMLKAQI
jgi:hypothetical protein